MGTVDNVINEVTDMVKRNWFVRLFDSSDTSVSATTVFMIAITMIGLILLFVPVVVLLVEIYYNHTITTDLNGLAAYIAAVAAIFTTGGIAKAWTNWSSNKYGGPQQSSNSTEDLDFEP